MQTSLYPEVANFINQQTPFSPLAYWYHAFYYRFVFAAYYQITQLSIEQINIETLERLLSELNIDWKVTTLAGDAVAPKQLKTHSLWVANHDSWLEAFLMLALVTRLTGKTPAIVAMLVNATMFPGLPPILIPVSNSSLADAQFRLGGTQAWIASIQTWLGKQIENLTPDQITAMNQAVVDRIVEQLSQRPVILFPSGGAAANHWFSGIGYALLQTKKQKQSLTVIPVQLKGSKTIQLIRQELKHLLGIKKPHTITATVGRSLSPSASNQLIDQAEKITPTEQSDNSKSIAKVLTQLLYNWYTHSAFV